MLPSALLANLCHPYPRQPHDADRRRPGCAHPADLPRNLDDHLRLMRIAQARGVRLLVFPELSLTGYEPTAAAALAQPADTPLLQPLRQLAEQARMTRWSACRCARRSMPSR